MTTIHPRTRRSVLLQYKAIRLWKDRDRLIDLREHYGRTHAWADATYQKMGDDIERLADRAHRCEERSREIWDTPYLADMPCECGSNPDAPACAPCSARADLQEVPF